MRSTDARPTLEATNNGKTRSRGLCAGARRGGRARSAQTGSSGTSTAQSTSDIPNTVLVDAATTDETRPATTTFFGDTGLWFVPTAEVLANGKWSVSGYRRGTNYIQGYTNVGDFAGTFARRRSRTAPRSSARSCSTRASTATLRPLFVNDPTYGGIVDRYPRVNQRLDRRQRRRPVRRRQGQSLVASTARIRRRSPCAASSSCRPARRTPASTHGQGRRRRSTSSSARKRRSVVEVSGYAGYEFRGSPDGFDIADGRVPLGRRRRRFRRAARCAVVARVERLRAVERHGDDHRRALIGRRRQRARRSTSNDREPDARDAWR